MQKPKLVSNKCAISLKKVNKKYVKKKKIRNFKLYLKRNVYIYYCDM